MEKATKENKVKKDVISKKKSRATSTQAVSSRKSSSKKSIPKASTNTKKKSTVKLDKSAQETKTTTSKKTQTKKKTTTTTKKKVATKKIDRSPKMKIDRLEYYDLPYRYNQTIVKLLFQTPKTLFVYWDITDSDRENYKNLYGENFFENTKPVLVIHNETKHYTFEIEINDFANSWYFNIPDSNCKYVIELGRRPKNQKVSIPNNYLYITSSNQLDSPNDKILFAHNQGKVIYKNAKTHQLSQKDLGSIAFMKNLKEIYSISDFYHKIYEQELLQELENHTLKNPSSGIM